MGAEWPEKTKRSETSPEKRKRTAAQTSQYVGQMLGSSFQSLGQIPRTQRSLAGAIIAIAIFLAAVSFFMAGRGGMCPAVLTMLFCAAIPALLVAVVFAGWWMGWRHFGPAEIMLSADEFKRGDKLQVNFHQDARSRITIPGYSLRMVLRETVRYQRGTDTITEHYDHVVEKVDFAGWSLGPGDSLDESVEFEIPAGAMHSFDQPDNKLRWYIVAEVLLKTWPHEVKNEVEFTVLAEGRQP